MSAYYNEIDPFAAQWLRELIAAGQIAPGEVDERSILDVHPDDLRPFTQCHFFSGIGVWSYALRLAGWPDDMPVWTGSCPCQPFSAAGKGAGFSDDRHLWPDFHWHIQQCRPPIVFGEQVANVPAWIDLVQADVEALGYAFGCVAFPAASVGAPHMRDRAYWVADSNSITSDQRSSINRGRDTRSDEKSRAGFSGGGVPSGLANASSEGLEKRIGINGIQREEGFSPEGKAAELCVGLGKTASERRGGHSQRASDTGATHWDGADWLYCRDGKYRPVEPGTFPLANGAPARVGRLRGYGNAIVAQQAEAFIKAAMRVYTC